MKTMSISKKDVLWSYFSQMLSIGSGIIILPVILHKLEAQEIGIYYILLSINSFILLCDAGFSPQFARNITYVFNGANTLKKEGFETTLSDRSINYRLLATVIKATQYTYKYFALIAGILLLSLGSFYIYSITAHFSSINNTFSIWLIYCISTFFNIYFLYYNSLLIGRGFIKESQKTSAFSKVFGMLLTVILIYYNWGLIGFAIANLLSPIAGRFLARFYFFRDGLKQKIQHTISNKEIKSVLSVSWPNIKKLSIITIAGYIVSQLGLFLSGLYLSLSDVASYGLMIQLVNVISVISCTLVTIQTPAFASYRVTGNMALLMKKFAFSITVFYPLFIVGSLLMIYAAPTILSTMRSNATLPSASILIIYCFIRLLETNHSCFANIISSANHIPFLKAALLSGLCILIGYGLLITYTEVNILTFVLVPGIVQLSYQNWRWPQIVLNEFKINFLQLIWMGNKEIKHYYLSSKHV